MVMINIIEDKIGLFIDCFIKFSLNIDGDCDLPLKP